MSYQIISGTTLSNHLNETSPVDKRMNLGVGADRIRLTNAIGRSKTIPPTIMHILTVYSIKVISEQTASHLGLFRRSHQLSKLVRNDEQLNPCVSSALNLSSSLYQTLGTQPCCGSVRPRPRLRSNVFFIVSRSAVCARMSPVPRRSPRSPLDQ